MADHAIGTHVFTPDRRNGNVPIDLNGSLFLRPLAKTSAYEGALRA